MKKYLIAVSAAALLTCPQANAADVVTTYQPEPLPIIPAFSWTGFYAGGQLGGTWGNAKTRLSKKGKNTNKNTPSTAGVDAGGLLGSAVKNKLKPEGFLGGLFAGYNFQLNDRAILGIETDFVWDDVDDSKKTWKNRAKDKLKDENKDNSSVKVKQKWNGATRLRAGYAFDRVMPYAAFGLAYTKIKGLYREDDNGRRHNHGKGKTRTGWTAGLGVDYIPPVFNDRIILRAEYRYTDFGKKTYKMPADMRYRVKYNQNDFRVGVAYKF